ncbi:MAG: hypothetical protein FH762_12835 [Firmicutes bacterium]|nr:hypothetical protein [Bacillota bacterium]
MKKLYIYIAVVIALMVAGYFLGIKLAGLAGGILAIFGLGTRKLKKESAQVMDQAEMEKKKADKIKKILKTEKKGVRNYLRR